MKQVSYFNALGAVVSTLDDSAVTARGTVLVTPELNVKLASGARNVWAMGDIIDWPEQKVRLVLFCIFLSNCKKLPDVRQGI